MHAPSADDALDPLLSVADMQALRLTLGDAIQEHQAIAMLDIGNQRCRLMVSERINNHPQPVWHHIPLGLDILATRTFRQRMPTEAQLEQAIMLVEDAVMPLARLVPGSHVFVTRDPCLLAVAQHALGVEDVESVWQTTGRWPMLARDAVEHLFEQLAQQSSHPQIPDADLPQSPRWAAALVLLREVLHHWQIGAMRLLPPLRPTRSPTA